MPGRIVNMEAIQTRKEGVFSLEMVISRDPAASSRAPNGEVQLALPPIERSGFPGIPSLVCHSDIPGEWGGSGTGRRCLGKRPESHLPHHLP